MMNSKQRERYLKKVERMRAEAIEGDGVAALYSMLVEDELPKLIALAKELMSEEKKTNG